MNIFQKFSDMIINTSEWLQNISEECLPIFAALFDGLMPEIVHMTYNMIVNGCYVSVGFFCIVCNGIHSKMFIF